MDLDLVHVLEFSLVQSVLVLVLNANLSVLVILTSKQDVLLWLNLQVVAASKRMNLSFETFSVLNCSCSFISDGDDIDSLIRNDKEIVGWEQKSFNWTFPKLETFVPELDKPSFQAENKYVESVDSNAFITNNHILDRLTILVLVFQHLNLAIGDFKFVFPSDEIL